MQTGTDRTAEILAAIPEMERHNLEGALIGLIEQVDREHKRYSAMLPAEQPELGSIGHFQMIQYSTTTWVLSGILSYATGYIVGD